MENIKRTLWFLIGLLLVAIAFNVFISPYNFVAIGTSGLSIVINNFLSIDKSLIMLILNIIILIIGYFALGKKMAFNSLLGTLLLPLFIKISSHFPAIINLDNMELILIAILGGVLSGIGYGLIFREGFTSGGTDVLNMIMSKYLKITISKSIIFIDGIIVILGGLSFGIEKMVYSILILILISYFSNNVMLSINKNKSFIIITSKEKEIKKYLLEYLKKDSTIFDIKGGYTEHTQKAILTVIEKSEYYRVKEEIMAIDPNAFISIIDSYEAMNQNISINN